MFSDLGPIKYELMTLCGLILLRGSFMMMVCLCLCFLVKMLVRECIHREQRDTYTTFHFVPGNPGSTPLIDSYSS